MNADYQIERAGKRFRVFDPWGEYLVDMFPTREAAEKDIERCKRNDALYETAKQLVDIAIEAHAQKFGVGRKTAQYWAAAERVDEGDGSSWQTRCTARNSSFATSKQRNKGWCHSLRIGCWYFRDLAYCFQFVFAWHSCGIGIYPHTAY